MERIRGVGFDLDHTLAIDNRLERVAFLRLLQVVLSEGGGTVGTLADEIDAIDELLEQQRHGDYSIDDAVLGFVARHGVEPNERHVETFRRYAVGMVSEFLVPLPGVQQTLAALNERGIAVAILSNGWNPLQQRKADQSEFHGPVLVSSEIGEQKPAPGAFAELLRTLGTEPRETIYVGDDPNSDVAGAHEAGIRAVWLNWERRPYPPGLRAPDYTIAQLDQLVQLLPVPERA
jgi:HAD superfamily hydrolase (TIGR01509 family)